MTPTKKSTKAYGLLSFLTFVLLTVSTTALCQRATDKLDRGLVAIPANSNGGNANGNFVSWRIPAEEYYDVTYNLYADGVLIAKELNTSNFLDTTGTATTSYEVAAVVRGKEQQRCAAVRRWDNGYWDIPVEQTTDRSGQVSTSNYVLNDACAADVTGDGRLEFIVKRLSVISTKMTNKTVFNLIECYDMSGKRLWWIDCGPNLISQSDVELDAVAFDWDGDGRAEIVMRGADNMIVHKADGTSVEIGDMSVDTRWDKMKYTTSGREFLLYLNGQTGEPYPIGPEGRLWMDYPLPRYEVGETKDLLGSSAEAEIWGKGIAGHRPTKHYFGAPFLDGKHASIFIARGCYSRHKMVALDVDPATHKLSVRWRWKEYKSKSPWFGQGYHNFAIADVDWDGRDEIVFGSMVIDDNGKGLSTTNLGHGDAQHCGDLDPYRHGQEQFACNEGRPCMNYRNATTSKIYYRFVGTNDDGRALCGNFSNQFPGCEGRSIGTGMISTVADKTIDELADNLHWTDLNFRIYWDGDLLDEILNSPGIEKDAKVDKLGGGRLFLSSGCKMNNWTKNTPCLQGDILGDWREEIVVRTEDNSKLRIYTTPHPTEFRIPTLWHDHQYRQAMVWECIGYNQPPHVSFFVGELEGITAAPPPLTTTGRTLIPNGSTISSAHNGKQLLINDFDKDIAINVADGASPHVVFFNVPSWIQGTNSPKTDGTAVIKREYRSCTLKGGAFDGDTRLVKQGDGILTMPAIEQRYSGPTEIWAGTLRFDGSLKHSDLWLNRFTVLETKGGKFKSIKMDYAAQLRPKDEATIDTLFLGFGSRVMLKLHGSSFKSDIIHTNKLTIETKDWNYGPEHLSPVFEIMSGKKNQTTGKYLLMDGIKELVGSLHDITIEGLNTTQKSCLTLEDDKLFLTIENVRKPSSVVWKGTTDSTWDYASTANFADRLNGQKAIFASGDDILFDDSSASSTVTLDGTLESGNIVVDATKDYSFVGRGSIVGKGSLTKRGSGKLTISTDNAFTGGVLLSKGTIAVSSLSNAYQDKGNLGATLEKKTAFVIENGATLLNTANVTLDAPISILGEKGAVFQTDAMLQVQKTLSGTLLTKKGKGQLILFAKNFIQRLEIENGTVELRKTQSVFPIELQDGELVDFAANVEPSINVPSGKNATWVLSNWFYLGYANKLTGGGNLTIIPTNTLSRVRITGDWSEFTGTIKHTTPKIWFPLDASTGLPNGTLDLAAGCNVTNVCKSFTIGRLTGKGSLNHAIADFVSKDPVSGNNTWRVGNSSKELGDFTFDGVFHDTGGENKSVFEKIGTCKMTVTGAWTNSGTVTISEGELHLAQGASLGKGALTVVKGATLSGTTKADGNLNNSSVTIDGILQVGQSADAIQGCMNFGNRNVSFSTGSILQIGIAHATTDSIAGCTTLNNIDSLTMNGTIQLHFAEGFTPKDGDSFIIWKAQSFVGTPKLESDVVDANKGLYWDAADLSKGILRVALKK